jgi:excisionase family DNA binding protein
MTKTEAAKALGVSEKTVSRYLAAGRLPSRYVMGKTGKQLDFEAADVEKLKAELAAPVEVVTAPRTSRDSTTLARLDSPSGAAQVEALARLVRAVVDAGQGEPRQDAARVSIAEKMLLSLDEAAQLSGVSRGQLRAAIHSGQLSARIVGRGFKVQPSALKAWCDGLFVIEAKAPSMATPKAAKSRRGG